MTNQLSGWIKRRWLGRAIPAGVAVLAGIGVTAVPALGATRPAAPTTPVAPVTSLVAPTGHHRAGTAWLDLLDPARIDPMSPTHARRELPVRIWYPAASTRGFPPTPYLPPLAAAHFLARSGLPPGTKLPQTTGHASARVDRRDGPYPVVLYSPGSEVDAELDTGLVEDLVSHGYVVVTMDDTNESPEVEFPDGRLVLGTWVPTNTAQELEQQQIRAADASFVLNELTVLNHGGNPAAGHDPLPAGLAGSLNLSEIGMFGWSIGGAASAQAMHDDPRIKAAVNMDGTFWGPLDHEGVNRPFLMLTGSEHTKQNDPRIAPFLTASTGPKLHLALANSKHATFSDIEELETDLAPALGVPAGRVQEDLGTISPKTAVTDERAYIEAFFGKYLRHHDNHLLDGPSPRFPDISFES
jgi:predicted dienelactone hydrolase